MNDTDEIAVCSECGAECLRSLTKCWLCGGELTATHSLTGKNPYQSPPTPPNTSERSFSLASMMLVITLVAVCLGVFAQAPGIGVVLAILCTPALIRTLGIRKRRRAKGVPMSAGEKVLAFFSSLAVVTTIAVASIGAFVTICFSMGLAAFSIADSRGTSMVGPLFIGGWVLGIGVGGVIGFFLIRWLWRRKD